MAGGMTPLDSACRRVALIKAERLCALPDNETDRGLAEVMDEGLAARIGKPDQYAVIGAPVRLRPDEV